MFNHFEHTDKTLIMGRSGCGKSYLARRLQGIWPRRIIIDSLSEYDDHKNKFYDFNLISTELINLKAQNARKFTLVFQFNPENEDANEVFNQLIRVGYYFGNLLIVIEEVQNFSSPHYLPHWLKNALLTGRHKGLALMFTTQRPGELNKTIVSQCKHIFCGNLIDKNDINYVSGFLNEESIKLINLKDRQFIYRGPSGITQISNDF